MGGKLNVLGMNEFFLKLRIVVVSGMWYLVKGLKGLVRHEDRLLRPEVF